jgi:hypothetical protein
MVAHWEVCPPASLRTDRSDSASSPHFHRACGIAALTNWIIREVRRKCKARDIENRRREAPSPRARRCRDIMK